MTRAALKPIDEAYIEKFDFAGALDRPTTRVGQTLDGRRAAEKRRMGEADRRGLQVTGRTDQLNFRVTPMLKLEFSQHAQQKFPGSRASSAEMFERVWDLHKRMEARAKALGVSPEDLIDEMLPQHGE